MEDPDENDKPVELPYEQIQASCDKLQKQTYKKDFSRINLPQKPASEGARRKSGKGEYPYKKSDLSGAAAQVFKIQGQKVQNGQRRKTHQCDELEGIDLPRQFSIHWLEFIPFLFIQ